MVPLIITLLQWEFVVTTMVVFFSVPIESVTLFLHVFLCLKVILTKENYMKLLTIFIWKFAIFWNWQLAVWKLGQLAPALFFYLQQAHSHHVWDIYVGN